MGSNLEAAQSNDLRAALIAARDSLAEAMDKALRESPGAVAQLAGQYRLTLHELEALPSAEVLSPLEQAKQARSKRRGDLKAV